MKGWTRVGPGGRALKPEKETPPAQQPNLAELCSKVENLLAVVGVGKGGSKGKGGPEGGCFVCGGDHYANNCPKAKGKGKDGKGKGKGKGKGRKGWALCHHFQKKGWCTREGCPYAHGKVPPGLSELEGLVVEDFGAVSFDQVTGVFTPSANLDIEAIKEKVKAELGALEDLDQGFPGQPLA